MPRKITVTTKELEALRWISERSGIFEDGDKRGAALCRALAGLLAKAEKSHAAPASSPDTVTIGELETALLNSGGKNVCKMARLTAREYAMLGRDIRERGIIAEQMRTLGLWLRDQQWPRDPFTLQQVVHHWGNWFARAQVHKPRSAGPALLEGD